MAAPNIVVKVALDWTPNTIHSGLFLAKASGIYEKHGLEVELLSPGPDYDQTPARRLQDGEVDLAICPSESCIAYQQSGKMQLCAIYAILQRDASAIVSTRLSKISELGNGKVYGSYNARYEDDVVKAMIKADGGNADGVKLERQQGKLSLFTSLKDAKVDATWVFLPWEGVEATLDGVTLHSFRIEDYGIPYGYSPVIAYNASSTKLSEDVLSKFVAATIEGYRQAMDGVDLAVRTLATHCDPPRSEEFLRRSQQAINESYSDGSALGQMSTQRWKTWVDWLHEQGLLGGERVDVERLFKNP
ncbi:hypothetical protein LTR91_002046 [Friedmanniomyces endolithicus]|uniref:4-amino-5-hydroxymethyl-2-methylpyrimidine phosphate synthase n=1 Tax=Friedmanniomyces endolithicus TaxID=329885 RepID=A0A4U0UP46_9PEZI|nr:hypothetical protein LTS09_013091 [Friedmanniomyces endolithicus]KAK0268656.1 hypothetical protein LTR35_015391 [Friedmanniomyces endolithicus]KAK0275031.1 hypothetical protein LTS00_015194 [Friedmanniomyces endolithicus]KAK0324053.1 hypothetical protein LTR82_005174 [Friedmanniomyces endolithicus]KAK0926631.1 hypothetical protein LTR57_004086 [Friedmanniomyces endolithicus]